MQQERQSMYAKQRDVALGVRTYISIYFKSDKVDRSNKLPCLVGCCCGGQNLMDYLPKNEDQVVTKKNPEGKAVIQEGKSSHGIFIARFILRQNVSISFVKSPYLRVILRQIVHQLDKAVKTSEFESFRHIQFANF